MNDQSKLNRLMTALMEETEEQSRKVEELRDTLTVAIAALPLAFQGDIADQLNVRMKEVCLERYDAWLGKQDIPADVQIFVLTETLYKWGLL